MKILIPEDDAVSRTVLEKTVEKFGHECLVSEDGAEAWEAYRNTPDVEVIISDLMMPITDGLKDLILHRALAAEIRRVAEEEGMTRLGDDGLMKAARGVTTIEEVLRTVV